MAKLRAGILSMQRIYNYGSFLQAYGLKSILEELGCDVEFVDYVPEKCLVKSFSSNTGEMCIRDSLCADVPEGFRSGFVALVGRPNAGKSTLLNACYGEKVAITSPVAQTTRRRLRAVVNREDCQLVIVDTPGIHKPKDGLGSELNKSALGELSDVDVIAFVIDASAPIGRGDAWVAERVAAAKAPKVLVLTKADLASPEQMLKQLEACLLYTSRCV